MDQIEQYEPPPNPAKLTDSRASAYVAEFGDDSWELDALEPTVIETLIDKAISEQREDDKWDEAVAEEEEHRAKLAIASEKWEEIAESL